MMKRFGMYNNDYNNLFECYNKVCGEVITEFQLPSETREKNTRQVTGNSFPDLKKIKIFHQKFGRGADLVHQVDLKRIDSDDGAGGVILTGSENDKLFNIVTNKKTAQVKLIDRTGQEENNFVTNVEPRFDPETKELSIIQIDEL